jgi:predicted acylesterase/phospholipase RssA
VKTLKVAFAMGGGASLGAFSGGAMAEVVRQLCGNVDRARYGAVEIDVLSGASAGGMTVGLLARALADPGNRDAARAARRVRDLMHEAWVQRIGIEELIPDPAMKHRASLFDRGAVDAIARRLLAWPGDEAPRPVLLGARVCMGLTLMNYNGIPISLTHERALGDALSTTLFRDYRVYCLDFDAVDRGVPDRWMRLDARALGRDRVWKELAATMIAGGAVPLAFEPVVLRRFRREFGALWPPELEGEDDFLFTHGDGGTFDNEPLRQAMQMIGFLDAGDDPASFERVLIAIDPNIHGPLNDFSLDFHRSHEINPDYGLFDGEDVVPADYAGRLASNAARIVTALRGQAAFKDFLAADKVNNRLRWREEMRAILSRLIGAADAGQLRDLTESATRSLEGVLAEKRAVSTVPDTGLALDAELNRVWAESGGDRDLDDPTMRLECTLLSLLDQVGALRGKQPVSVFAIAPTAFVPVGGAAADARPVELAGDFAASFGGFFDRAYREHDFALGAAVAGSVLSCPPASGPLGQGLLADPSDRPGLPAPSDPTLGTNEAARERFADRLGHVAEALLRHRVRNQIVRLIAGPRVRSAVAGMIGDGAAARTDALVRLEVTSPPGEDDPRFRLRAARGGDDSALVRVGSGGSAVLETVVRFSPDGAAALDGPHVHERDGRWVLVVASSRRGRPDPEMAVPLPPVDRLRAEMPFGLPVHEVQVAWVSRSVGAWSSRNALVGLDEQL